MYIFLEWVKLWAKRDTYESEKDWKKSAKKRIKEEDNFKSISYIVKWKTFKIYKAKYARI